MAEQVVELQPGESKLVSFEAIPHEARTYHVSVDGLTGSFRAVAKAKFYIPAEMTVKVTDGSILGMYWRCEFSAPITNVGDVPGTYTITYEDNAGRGRSREITLSPGETYDWSVGWYVDFRRFSPPLVCVLEGDWPHNNYSSGEAWP